MLVTPIFHPNIDQFGYIDMSILFNHEGWTSSVTIRDFLHKLLALLQSPDCTGLSISHSMHGAIIILIDPLRTDVAITRSEFERKGLYIAFLI